MKNESVKKTAILGMAAVAAMILSYVESFFYLGMPGVKVGLPNIFVVCILYLYGAGYALALSLVRCVLSALLFGSVMSFWYSLAGAVLSLAVMSLLKHFDRFSPMGVSVAGGVCHNAAQIAVAVFVTRTVQIGYYLPILAASGVVAGAVIGIVSAVVTDRVKNTPFFEKKGAKKL